MLKSLTYLPLLTSTSSNITGSRSHQYGNQQLKTPPVYNVSMFEQSFNTPYNNIEHSPLGQQTQHPQIQALQTQHLQTQISYSMVTRYQKGIVKPNPKYDLTSYMASTSIPCKPLNI